MTTSSIRRRSAAWTILVDWTYRSSGHGADNPKPTRAVDSNLLDNFVGAREKGFRNCNTQRSCGVEVDV